jgi:hypothetical protein
MRRIDFYNILLLVIMQDGRFSFRKEMVLYLFDQT